ncbi:MAG: lanthionine synthetase C family protein [Candidatus Rhabdochlamydia sp.]
MIQIKEEEHIALDIAREIAKRFAIDTIVCKKEDFSFDLGGYTSLITLYSTLSRVYASSEWDSLLHYYISNIVKILESQGLASLALIGGLAGACSAISLAGQEKNRYEKLQNSLNGLLINSTKDYYLKPLQENISCNRPSHCNFYDVISGVAGIGNYLLGHVEKKGFLELLKNILSTLVSFCSSLVIHGQTVPGWYRHADDEFLAEDRSSFPKGNFNLGFAHGIPGILAFLSLSLSRGIVVDKQQETIARIAKWIWDKHAVGKKGIFWGARVSFEEETTGIKEECPFVRDAWCYGTPGVSRALFLAGLALNDKQIQSQAIEALKNVFCRSREEWCLPDPSFCHGLSGLLTLTYKMYQETNLPFFKAKSQELKNTLLSSYNPQWELGFFPESLSATSEPLRSEKVGLLEGISGILLPLLWCDFPTEDAWTRFFVIN